MLGKPKQLDAEALWRYALKVLGARSYSISEMRDRLNRRAEKADDAGAVLSRLKQYGYLNDRQLAESYASARMENQTQGRLRVVQDLRKKRVAPVVAEAAVREVYQDTDEAALAEAFLSRKYRKVRLSEFLADPKSLASAYRKLRLAGFTSGICLRVLKKFAREPEILERIEEGEERPPEE